MEEENGTTATVRRGWADSRRRADIGPRSLDSRSLDGPVPWPGSPSDLSASKAGNNHHPWQGNRSGGCNLGEAAQWQLVAKLACHPVRLPKSRRLRKSWLVQAPRSRAATSSDTDQAIVTPFARSPGSAGLPKRGDGSRHPAEVVIQGRQLCARVSRFASGQEFGMKRSRRRDERSRRNGACARCHRAAAQKKCKQSKNNRASRDPRIESLSCCSWVARMSDRAPRGALWRAFFSIRKSLVGQFQK